MYVHVHIYFIKCCLFQREFFPGGIIEINLLTTDKKSEWFLGTGKSYKDVNRHAIYLEN